MIQPINAFSPRAGFRGSKETYGKRAPKSANSKIALINAGGVALAAGGITTAVARSYTHSWGHAGVLGVGGAFLAMFFMTPHLIDKKTFGKIGKKAESKRGCAKNDRCCKGASETRKKACAIQAAV